MDTNARDSDGFAARLLALAAGFDVLGMPVAVFDRNLRYRYVNAEFLRHGGRKPSDFLGRTVEEAFPSPPPDDRRAMLHRALAGEAVVYNRRTTEGPNTGRWVRAHYLPLRDDAGGIDGVVVVLVDIQQLKDVEAALAERERHLSLIMDSVGFPVTYLDRRQVIRFANRPSREWSGVTPEEMVGKRLQDVVTNEVMAAVGGLIDRALA